MTEQYLQTEVTADPLILLGTGTAGTAAAGADAKMGFNCTASAANFSASSRSSIHFICMRPTAEPWTLPYNWKSRTRLSTSKLQLQRQQHNNC